jgi:hypothetical protein
MALLYAVTLAVLAVAHGGMVNMMQPQMPQMPMPMQQTGGCQMDPQTGGCVVPMGVDNVEEYMEQQMQAQQYETQQMAEQINAQFESLMRDVTQRKHRYVMSLVGDFVSACYCAESSAAVGAAYLESARTLNLTEDTTTWDSNREPYQAVNAEDARGLIFMGLIRRMCEAAKTFNTFAQQVENRIPFYRAQSGKK